ncbi:unnamed protein product [Rotaria sp. Silwood2]|nr:unnamed protein product [Rotaria sp. Silwood2]CAF4039586.1 unnamed protein product [Rotaria sp. Silwood2]
MSVAISTALSPSTKKTMIEQSLFTIDKSIVEKMNDIILRRPHIDEAKLIISRALRGQEEDINILQYISKRNHAHQLGPRRFHLLVIRAMKVSSPLYNYYVDKFHINYINDIKNNLQFPSSKNYIGRLLYDLNCSLTNNFQRPSRNKFKKGQNNQIDNKQQSNHDDNSVLIQPIEFVKFEVARQLIERNRQQLNRNLNENIECPICFENKKELISLHNDRRHSICNACRTMILICPFCRKEL